MTSKIAVAQQEIASLDAEKAQALAILNQPQNRDVADQSQFLNDLFARKALSWTRVFTEMERLMPPNIHVVSMKPEFNRDNQLVLHVVVVTSARDKRGGTGEADGEVAALPPAAGGGGERHRQKATSGAGGRQYPV